MRPVLGFTSSLLVCGCILIACESEPSLPDNPEVIIEELIAAGAWDDAEQLGRQLIRSEPENARFRLLLGDTLLAAGDGRNAVVAFGNAGKRGADENLVKVGLARALLLQEDFLGVLDIPAVSGEATDAAAMELRVIRLRAELALPGGEDDRLRTDTQTLIKELDLLQSGATWAADLLAELEQQAPFNERLQNGLDHARCKAQLAGSPAVVDAEHLASIENLIRVGPSQNVKTIAAAAKIASDGATIAIDPGEYPGDVAIWPQNDLTIIGLEPRPHVSANGRSVNQRDIWLFTGNNVHVDNVAFSGARAVRSQNGAGIRHTGANLTIRRSYFADSDNGVLTYKDGGQIRIEYSEFTSNGFGDGQSHNVYIGTADRLIFRHNYSSSAHFGHLLKTRAAFNDIRYNRLSGEDGNVSYVVNIPNGGEAYIVGNEMEKAVNSENPHVVSYGEEGLTYAKNTLAVTFNSIYNRNAKTFLVRNESSSPALIQNNLIGGAPLSLASGPSIESNNFRFPEHGMTDPRNLDFRLTAAATAIDAAEPLPVEWQEQGLVPQSQYAHPARKRDRIAVGNADVGAHEYCAQETKATN